MAGTGGCFASMKTSHLPPKAELARRDAQLSAAADQLKAQFVGIDAQIDQLLEHIRPWFLLPGQQERPRIVNLWGMTGVGKTALVQALVQLLELQNRFFPVDLSNHYSLKSDLAHSLEHAHLADSSPAIILLDEFQKARSLNNQGEELPEHNPFLWNLLDHGLISYVERDFLLRNLQDLQQQLELALALGVEVQQGLVVAQEAHYRKIFNMPSRKDSFEPDGGPLPFIEAESVDALWESSKQHFPTRLQLREALHQLDGAGTLAFVQKAVAELKAPRLLDCRQDLVIVAGNLDAAYQCTDHTDPELEADQVRRLNERVNLSAVKTALLERFRPEQVARLGNNHVVYPAFSNEAFAEIIRRGLQRLSARFEAATRIPLHFAPSVHELVYKEGVFPSQGTRPVFSTLENLAGSRLANWQLAYLEVETACSKVEVLQKDDQLVARFLDSEGAVLQQKQHDLHLPLKLARKPRRDDKQALVAVHEAGHTVLSCALLGRLPAKVVSQSTDNQYDGYMLNDVPPGMVSKRYLLRMIAVFLGGLAAETLIFGEEHITLGSSSDLREATRWLHKAYRKSGFTGVWASYGADVTGQTLLNHNDKAFEKAILATLAEARQLAIDTLQFERDFLLAVAHELANRQQLNRRQIDRLRKAHMLGSLEQPLLRYRARLLEQVGTKRMLL